MYVWLVVLMFVFCEGLRLVWPGHKAGFLMLGATPAGCLLHVGPCQRIHFIWSAYLRLRWALVCVPVCVWFPEIEIVWVCPFCSLFQSGLEVWTQQLQVHVCKALPHMCTRPRSSVRSRSVKLDGGLLKVIMSKVPFSQDEQWAANCGAAILYLIIITPRCFFFFK